MRVAFVVINIHHTTMKRFLLAVLLLGAPLHAQPELPPVKAPRAKERAPQINPEAKALVETMIAHYQKLGSYSDTTHVEIMGGGNLPPEFRAGYPVEARLSWSRPARLRFEGTMGGESFLALSDETTIHAVKAARPGLFLERLQHLPRLEAALMETDATALGTAFMTEPDFWTRTLEDVTVLALETDAEMGRQACRVVNVQAEGAPGNLTLIRLWIAKTDGLLRRMEFSDAQMGANSKITETHSEVQLNPVLPDSTWKFEAPVGAKAVEYFPDLEPHKYDPTIQIGDSLPSFSGDGLDGAPVELNPKSGKVTILCFFTLGMGPGDVRGLQGLQRKLGADKVQVVGVSGDGRRARVEKFALENKITIPIFFDDAGMNNRLTGLFGVRKYTTTLVFGKDGKLAASLGSTRAADFSDAIQKLFPTETPDLILNALDDETPAFIQTPAP